MFVRFILLQLILNGKGPESRIRYEVIVQFYVLLQTCTEQYWLADRRGTQSYASYLNILEICEKLKSLHLKSKTAFERKPSFSSMSKLIAYVLNWYFICSNSQCSPTLNLIGSVVTRLRAGRQCFDCYQEGRIFLFFKASGSSVRPNEPSSKQKIGIISLGFKRLGHETELLP
jgi:hypothetical protein